VAGSEAHRCGARARRYGWRRAAGTLTAFNRSHVPVKHRRKCCKKSRRTATADNERLDRRRLANVQRWHTYRLGSHTTIVSGDDRCMS
jgi:hypothetical protein